MAAVVEFMEADVKAKKAGKKVAAIRAGSVWDKWMYAAKPGDRVTTTELYNANRDSLIGYYGNEDRAKHNMSAAIHARIRSGDLAKVDRGLYEKPRVPETPQQRQPEPVEELPAEPQPLEEDPVLTHPPIASPHDPMGAILAVAAKHDALVPTEVLSAQPTVHERVGEVMDQVKRLLRKEGLKFSYTEEPDHIKISVPLPEDD